MWDITNTMESVEDVLAAIDALTCDPALKDVLRGIIALVDNGDLNLHYRAEHNHTVATKKAYSKARHSDGKAVAAPAHLKEAKRPKSSVIPVGAAKDLPDSLRRLAERPDVDDDSSS